MTSSTLAIVCSIINAIRDTLSHARVELCWLRWHLTGAEEHLEQQAMNSRVHLAIRSFSMSQIVSESACVAGRCTIWSNISSCNDFRWVGHPCLSATEQLVLGIIDHPRTGIYHTYICMHLSWPGCTVGIACNTPGPAISLFKCFGWFQVKAAEMLWQHHCVSCQPCG